MGLDGKLLSIFKDMYCTVKSCNKHWNTLSDFFDISDGLRQGQNNSPILFSLFLKDIGSLIKHDTEGDFGLNLFDLSFVILLFADGMVLIGKSVEELQTSLTNLFTYCEKWGLEVNTEKTKTMVFRKRGAIKKYRKMVLQ